MPFTRIYFQRNPAEIFLPPCTLGKYLLLSPCSRGDKWEGLFICHSGHSLKSSETRRPKSLFALPCAATKRTRSYKNKHIVSLPSFILQRRAPSPCHPSYCPTTDSLFTITLLLTVSDCRTKWSVKHLILERERTLIGADGGTELLLRAEIPKHRIPEIHYL